MSRCLNDKCGKELVQLPKTKEKRFCDGECRKAYLKKLHNDGKVKKVIIFLNPDNTFKAVTGKSGKVVWD